MFPNTYTSPSLTDFQTRFQRDFPFGTQFIFSVTSANATVGATYSDSLGNVYTVVTTIAAGTSLIMNGPNSAPAASTGTLTKVSGTGDSTITFTSFVIPSNQVTVTGADITLAMQTCGFWINPNLFTSQASYTNGYLLASAHFLVITLRASSQGIWGQMAWPVSSKSAGGVAQGFSIPDRILENPQYAMLTQTTYGYQFLFFVLPSLCGQIITLYGPTNP